jgi:hypothetical protein
MMVLLPQVIEARDSGTPGPVLPGGRVKQDALSALRVVVSSVKHLAGGSSFASASTIVKLKFTASSERGEDVEERLRPGKKGVFL